MRTNRGLLISCDVALKQFILHLNAQASKANGESAFVIDAYLDDRHVFILAEEKTLRWIKRQIREWQDSNTFIASRDEPEAEKLGLYDD